MTKVQSVERIYVNTDLVHTDKLMDQGTCKVIIINVIRKWSYFGTKVMETVPVKYQGRQGVSLVCCIPIVYICIDRDVFTHSPDRKIYRVETLKKICQTDTNLLRIYAMQRQRNETFLSALKAGYTIIRITHSIYQFQIAFIVNIIQNIRQVYLFTYIFISHTCSTCIAHLDTLI